MFTLGVTGTTHPTDSTLLLVEHNVVNYPADRWVTGGARGVDVRAAQAVLGLTDKLLTVVYPEGEAWEETAHLGLSAAFPDRVDFVPVSGGYMARNDELVAECDSLLAYPSQPVEVVRSGTWATVRRARKRGIPVHVFS